MVPLEEQLQLARDMLDGALNQRTNAQNECVTLSAQLKAALRRAEQAEARVAELEKAAAVAKANGADQHPAA